jgi:hypothetical protein
MGVELPRSGNSVRHATCSVLLHRTGKLVSVESPVPSGPRQAGQLAAFDKGAIRVPPANTMIPTRKRGFTSRNPKPGTGRWATPKGDTIPCMELEQFYPQKQILEHLHK